MKQVLLGMAAGFSAIAVFLATVALLGGHIIFVAK